MIILGIESAAVTASAAIVTDGVLTAEYTVNHKKTHSQTLLPMLSEICRMAELDRQKIDAIAVSAGPGSFTGLRIGGATAKGLGMAFGKPLVSVSTLEALAANVWGIEGLICPVMDARRGQVYTAVYRFPRTDEAPECLLPPCCILAADLTGELNRLGESVCFLGDGTALLKTMTDRLTVPFFFAPPHMSLHRAGSVAALGAFYYRSGKTVDAASFAPEYLRKSQAEQEQEAAEQAGEASVKALSQGIAPKLAADGDPERIGKAVQSRMEHEGAEV